MSNPAAADPPLLEQDLCTGCAACCDGTMFSYVELEGDEAERLGHVFAVASGPSGPVFHQPCPHSVGQRCQVYHDRPQTCRTFRCKTLKALRKGEVEAAEAFRRVTEMLRAREQIKPLLLEGETLNQARERRQAMAADPALAAEHTAFLLRLTAFDLLLDRYFRNPGKAMFSRNTSEAN